MSGDQQELETLRYALVVSHAHLHGAPFAGCAAHACPDARDALDVLARRLADLEAVEAERDGLRWVLKFALDGPTSNLGHIPFCPGFLAQNTCLPECARILAALAPPGQEATTQEVACETCGELASAGHRNAAGECSDACHSQEAATG